ncbi:MAG TPA: Do family serine endopeptidase [Gammaproteobacteria bacterium]|nr:Do family serine endopeptidase [Gammaproteobacteria bacterium]
MRSQLVAVVFLCLGVSVMSAARAGEPLPDFTGIVARAAPVVVNISTTRHETALAGAQSQDDGNDADPDWYQRFFGSDGSADTDTPAYPDDDANDPTVESLGSGFIVSSDGEILTNYHVIEHADSISVKLANRRVLPARVLGVDVASDLALLKVEAHKLPVADIGDARKLKVGQWVLAIGSPFGFDQSVTAGIVSAEGRNIGSEQYVPYIQTDVPINPGNSGGPLLNLDGEVVGINSEIYSRTGGYQGVSFAIPINLAMNVVDQLRQHGHVVRGWLGVNVSDMTPDMAEDLHLGHPQGALIRGVVPASPAARSGLKAGDVILVYDGTEVGSSDALPPLVGSTPAGRHVSVMVMRNGQRRTVEVAIAALQGNQQAAVLEASMDPAGSFDLLGLALRGLTGTERQAFAVPTGGALIEHVNEGAARRAGMRPGDILLSVNDQPVTSPRQFQRLESRLPDETPVPVLIRRQDSTLFVVLRLANTPP